MPGLRFLFLAVAGLLAPSSAAGQVVDPEAWEATLLAGVDTMDTYARYGPDGPIRRGATYLQTATHEAAGAWVLRRDWLDSLGAVETVQQTRTHRRSLATLHEAVRAPADSASLLAGGGRAAGWVVPAGGAPVLFDGEAPARLAPEVAELGFAAARPAPGETLRYPTYALYGGSPLATTVDTLRASGREAVRDGGRAVPCVLVERASGTVLWVEAATGRVLARRGQAAGGRVTWWHVRRGVVVPGGPGSD